MQRLQNFDALALVSRLQQSHLGGIKALLTASTPQTSRASDVSGLVVDSVGDVSGLGNKRRRRIHAAQQPSCDARWRRFETALRNMEQVAASVARQRQRSLPQGSVARCILLFQEWANRDETNSRGQTLTPTELSVGTTAWEQCIYAVAQTLNDLTVEYTCAALPDEVLDAVALLVNLLERFVEFVRDTDDADDCMISDREVHAAMRRIRDILRTWYQHRAPPPSPSPPSPPPSPSLSPSQAQNSLSEDMHAERGDREDPPSARVAQTAAEWLVKAHGVLATIVDGVKTLRMALVEVAAVLTNDVVIAPTAFDGDYVLETFVDCLSKWYGYAVGAVLEEEMPLNKVDVIFSLQTARQAYFVAKNNLLLICTAARDKLKEVSRRIESALNDTKVAYAANVLFDMLEGGFEDDALYEQGRHDALYALSYIIGIPSMQATAECTEVDDQSAVCREALERVAKSLHREQSTAL